jgi:hypothetical protein
MLDAWACLVENDMTRANEPLLLCCSNLYISLLHALVRALIKHCCCKGMLC